MQIARRAFGRCQRPLAGQNKGCDSQNANYRKKKGYGH
jgi:hypothetical protein